jgi:hypothetical protein
MPPVMQAAPPRETLINEPIAVGLAYSARDF